MSGNQVTGHQQHDGFHSWARAGRFFVRFAALLLPALAIFVHTQSQATTYQYDGNGRLRAATNSLGDSAIYGYDTRGNVLSIQRITGSPLNITAFSPQYGEPGVQVSISGSGFGTTTSANVVRFNGTSAAVLTASASQLLVMVPFNATSGKISVTTGGNTVVSTDTFNIAQLGLPPQISGFTPTSGNPGTVVTLSGTDLSPYPGQTTVRVNGLFVPTTSVTSQQIVFTVPPYMGSGLISVMTAYGRAFSSGIFLAVPVGISPSSVTKYPSLTSDGASQSINNTGRYAAFTFQGNPGDYLSLQLSAFTSSNNALNYQVYDPTNTLVTSGTLYPGLQSIDIPKVNLSGAYAVFFGSGFGTDQFTIKLERNQSVAVDGAQPGFSTLAGQSKRFWFSGTAGDKLGLGISELSLQNSTHGYVNVTVYKPDGSLLAEVLCYITDGGCDLDLVNLPATGTYSVLVQSPSSASEPNMTMSFSATISHEVTGTITAGTPLAVSLSRRGQNGRLSFSGTAGTSMALQIGGISTTPAGHGLALMVLKPDGTTLTSAAFYGSYTFNLANLPATGTYTLFVDPNFGATANLTSNLILSQNVAVAVDGSARNFSTTQGGQSAYFSFTGTAGDNLGVGISGLTEQNNVYTYNLVTVYKPDGSLLAEVLCYITYGGCDLDLVNLPATGTYTVLVHSESSTNEPSLTMSFTATVSHEVIGTLTVGTPLAVNLSRFGQNSRLGFSGTAGTAVVLAVGGISTMPTGRSIGLTVFEPNGTSLRWITSSDGHTFILPSLPVTGTYTLFVNPQYGATASLTVTMVPSQTVAVLVDGSSRDFSTMVGGQYGYFSFSGTAGDNLGVGISGLTVQNSSYDYLDVSVYTPDGSYLVTVPCRPANGGCDLLDLINLPSTGIYHVIVGYPSPPYEPNRTMSFTATVSHDLTGTLVSDTPLSTPLEVNLRFGQNGQLSFSGTKGKTVTLQVDVRSTTPAGGYISLFVLKPDGTGMDWTQAISVEGIVILPDPPVTGTYTLFVNPQYGAAASLTVTQR